MKFCVRYFYNEYNEIKGENEVVYLKRKSGKRKTRTVKDGKGFITFEQLKSRSMYDIVDNVYQSVTTLKRYYIATGIFLNGAKGCDIYKIENEKPILLETVEGLRDL